MSCLPENFHNSKIPSTISTTIWTLIEIPYHSAHRSKIWLQKKRFKWIWVKNLSFNFQKLLAPLFILPIVQVINDLFCFLASSRANQSCKINLILGSWDKLTLFRFSTQIILTQNLYSLREQVILFCLKTRRSQQCPILENNPLKLDLLPTKETPLG